MGNSLSALAQAFPPKPQWSVDSIPDLSGKVVLVTGSSSVPVLSLLYGLNSRSLL